MSFAVFSSHAPVKDKDACVEAIMEGLPTGSGFNTAWSGGILPSRRCAVFLGNFQHLHVDGYYDGWVQISVNVSWHHRDILLYKVKYVRADLNTRTTLKKYPELREYIQETIYDCMKVVIGKLKEQHDQANG